ncbi:hypothetical protein N7517_008119 [Penicillium concentricum]|uniref:Uncharacterized protein n=1 Tax=Penicillium concentricum TaxID=293559 RepID=A0A9W9RWQ5_9EURO|nr:uncharacterized protein N7517_008119 [Penicillium concentricum]KAJ5365233.1 hypothetical protein N7517_008119 [Penicillium concentricum]
MRPGARTCNPTSRGTVIGIQAYAPSSNCHPNVNRSSDDLVGSVLCGQQAGRAEAVDDEGWGSYRVSCGANAGAGDIYRAWAADMVDTDIFDEIWPAL